ncbi:penicillin-binding protein 1C [Marivirga arenosa]|uniref:peptidoglycan glycosyltransferase n=1 Tax=Marivirga arenosa TaxID=3059076 RepID=A0AA51ZVU8_9BACT|nr:penicillin-binding protein 1C [Marivirga sp. BKB1-2]WNB17697.1 penicillin-binding protein 1C [Marivirga sp. BKB1-2]
MWKAWTKVKKWQWILILIISVAIIYFSYPFKKPYFQVDYSTVVKSEEGSLLHVFLNKNEQWLLPPDTSDIPKKLETAVLSYEDQNFHSHFGVDIGAVFRALKQNIKAGRIVSGASTLTMQVARLKYQNSRNLFYKALEAIEAIKLSLHFSKKEILRMYLQHAPYGGNVIGYQTAAHKFFGKQINALTWSEAATLAVLPNAPGLIYPSKTSDKLLQKRNSLLKKLYEKEFIDEITYQLSVLESVPDDFIPFKSSAPHAASFLRTQYPNQKILNTTIDERLQHKANQIALKYKELYEEDGISSLAFLISDSKTAEIKAYVGSPDFYDNTHKGQVDGVRANRSSGSILKPFLYALSMDEGMILPETFIRDLPTYFDGFSPNNANEDFQGVVSAREALVKSLNIPAVRLLNGYGLFQFYSFLKEAGVSSLFRSADQYGLPLILGGAEVSVWDMARLYRGLANEGKFSDNIILKNETRKTQESAQLISGGSVYLTLDMLKDLKRPGSEYFWQKFNNSREFAWKTGTSYGHKDAWAVGLNPNYTIAVWVGNFDGESNKNLSGANSAGPILFDLLEALPADSLNEWFQFKEMDFQKLEICAVSGFRSSENCIKTEVVNAPYSMKSMKSCEYHQTKYLSHQLDLQTCSACWNKLGAIPTKLLAYPPDIAYYLRRKGTFIESIPPHNPECSRYRAENSSKIIYPNMDAKLFLPVDFNGELQKVICKVGHSSSVKKVYWYLNEVFLGETDRQHKMAIQFKSGWNELKIIDDLGGEDTQKVFAVVNQ